MDKIDLNSFVGALKSRRFDTGFHFLLLAKYQTSQRMLLIVPDWDQADLLPANNGPPRLHLFRLIPTEQPFPYRCPLPIVAGDKYEEDASVDHIPVPRQPRDGAG